MKRPLIICLVLSLFAIGCSDDDGPSKDVGPSGDTTVDTVSPDFGDAGNPVDEVKKLMVGYWYTSRLQGAALPVELLHAYHPDGWFNQDATVDMHVSHCRTKGTWDVTASDVKKFTVTLTFTSDTCAIASGSKATWKYTFKSDPATYDVNVTFPSGAVASSTAERCGTDWNVDSGCGQTTTNGVPEAP